MATTPAPLMQTAALTAVFHAGKSALGHHWELQDEAGTVRGRTRRAYGGGPIARGLWRAVTATGMDKDNDIRADVLDAEDQLVARLFSRNEKGAPRVELTGADGQPIGVARRTPGEGFVYEDSGGTVVARIPIAEDSTEPWPLEDPAGERLGVLTRQRAKREYGATLLDIALDISDWTDQGRRFQDTMHLGFAFSHTYGISLARLPPSEPLRTLAVLTPVIAAYAY